MIVWYVLSGSMVTVSGRSDTLPAGGIVAPPGISPNTLLKLMVGPQGSLVPRPFSPTITTSGSQHTIADCPVGTTIEVTDVTGGEIMAELTTTTAEQTEIINLPDPGEYTIRVAAPLPALPTERRIFQSSP